MDFMGLKGIQRGFKGFQEILRNFKGFLGIKGFKGV